MSREELEQIVAACPAEGTQKYRLFFTTPAMSYVITQSDEKAYQCIGCNAVVKDSKLTAYNKMLYEDVVALREK